MMIIKFIAGNNFEGGIFDHPLKRGGADIGTDESGEMFRQQLTQLWVAFDKVINVYCGCQLLFYGLDLFLF